MHSGAPHGQGRIAAASTGALACDVLDAWFDPSPAAVAAFSDSALAMRSSPETDGRGLIEAIAETRGLDPRCLCLGAGSSELIYRVLPTVAGEGPAVLLDPTYSEYPYLLELEGVPIVRVTAAPATGFRASMDELIGAAAGASLVALVNPNSPTGMELGRDEVLRVHDALPPGAALWVDETYVDFAPAGTSVEADACRRRGLYVLKSLSKAYALSGLRAAYLVCHPAEAAAIAARTPPWIVGTSAQAAAVAAVRDTAYYRARWDETAERVRALAHALREMGLEVTAGALGAVLVETPAGRTADQWAAELAQAGVIVRTPEGMGSTLGDRYVRISLIEPALMPSVVERIRSTL